MKKYQIIYADPPWKYNDKNCNGACEQHYKTISLHGISSLPIWNISDKNCVLFLWTTYPMLAEALYIIKCWGFQYKTIGFQWIKLNKKNKAPFYGLGRWTRGNTEPCLIATKGKPKRIAKDIFQLIQEPIMQHSRKPNKVRTEIVRLMGNLPRIELFARKRDRNMFGNCVFDGWDVWGNEVDNDIDLLSYGTNLHT